LEKQRKSKPVWRGKADNSQDAFAIGTTDKFIGNVKKNTFDRGLRPDAELRKAI
jgi:hypothetical protein